MRRAVIAVVDVLVAALVATRVKAAGGATTHVVAALHTAVTRRAVMRRALNHATEIRKAVSRNRDAAMDAVARAAMKDAVVVSAGAPALRAVRVQPAEPIVRAEAARTEVPAAASRG
jgi:hypothetical protein